MLGDEIIDTCGNKNHSHYDSIIATSTFPSSRVSPSGTPRASRRVARSTGLLHPRLLPVLVVALSVLILASLVVGVAIGSVRIPVSTVWEVVIAQVTGRDTSVPSNEQQIIWQLRVPRVALAGLVGAGLSVAGVAVQALVRNPIADPYVLGVSSGASVGATMVILFGVFAGLGSLGSLGISAAAFITAMASMTVVYLIAQRSGRLDPLRLVLSGVVIGYVLSALTSFLVFQADPRAAQQVLFWLLGSFGRARWSILPIPAVAVAGAVAVLFVRARMLDALASGDDAATTLGVAVGRLRIELFIITAALTAVLVAVSGAIGFVGLVVPHAVRALVGGLHRRVLVVSALLGALFMIWVDIAARTVAAPQEIPVGIITALVGGPVFIVLMRHRDRRLLR